MPKTLIARVEQHLDQMAPHVRECPTAELLAELLDAYRAAVSAPITQPSKRAGSWDVYGA